MEHISQRHGSATILETGNDTFFVLFLPRLIHYIIQFLVFISFILIITISNNFRKDYISISHTNEQRNTASNSKIF